MQTDIFELQFSKFLESKPYDEAEERLFRMMRLAFQAGWDAAKEADK